MKFNKYNCNKLNHTHRAKKKKRQSNLTLSVSI